MCVCRHVRRSGLQRSFPNVGSAYAAGHREAALVAQIALYDSGYLGTACTTSALYVEESRSFVRERLRRITDSRWCQYSTT